MNKYVLGLLLAFACGFARADDTADLAQLRPLTPQEQLAYDRITDEPAEVHKFVATRTYARAMDGLVARSQSDRNCDNMEIAKLAALPPVPGDFVFTYASDYPEQLCFYDIALVQKAPWLAGVGFSRQPAQSAQAAASVEIEYWRSIQSSADAADFDAYLARFPMGSFVELARNRLAKLRQPADPCDSLPGRWAWFTGADVEIGAHGSVKNQEGVTGNWSCDKSAVTIIWSSGFVDRLALSADRQHLHGQGGFLGLTPVTADRK